MKDESDRLIHERGLAFFGRMAASVSHELKNVLGILNELGGLLDDLLLAARKGQPIANEQLARIAEGINKQVRRGDGYVKKIHHFAHNVDSFHKRVPLDTVLDEIVDLCQRLAALRRVHLSADLRGGVAAAVGQVFTWQHAVYEGICIALDSVHEEDAVVVHLTEREAACHVEIVSSRMLRRDLVEERMPLLDALAAQLGGSVGLRRDGETREALVFSVPL